MNIYLKKDTTPSNHFVIDNLSDLLKISPEKLKNAQYSDFSGKYFSQINDEVIKSEKKQRIQKNENPKKNISINNNLNKNEDEEFKIDNSKDINIKKEYLNENESYIPQNKDIDYPYPQKNKIDVMRNINNQSIVSSYYNKNSQIFPIKKIIFQIIYNTIFGQEIAISGSNDKLGNWDKNNLLYLNWTKGNKWIGEIDINENDLEDFEFKFVLCYNKEIISWEPGENNNVYFTALFNEIKENSKGSYNKYQFIYDKNNGEIILNCKWSN